VHAAHIFWRGGSGLAYTTVILYPVVIIVESENLFVARIRVVHRHQPDVIVIIMEDSFQLCCTVLLVI
jgi:hypothetical protein